MSCPLEKFARVVGKCPVCLAEHEAGPSSLPGLIADWAEDDKPAPPDGVVSLPAPKPDELTVDDVLGVLRVAIAQHDVSLEGCTLALGTTGSVLVYTDGPGHAFEGTVAEAMAFAKRRGLLG